MPNSLIQFSFSGGVFSPSIHGRADLEKYSLGLRDALNYFIDYRGGAVSRAGTEFGDAIHLPAAGVLFKRFRFNNRVANTFLMILTAGKIRFAQNNAYVVEPAKVITGVINEIVSSTAHGYAAGDLVRIGALTLVVGTTTANTFVTLNFNGGTVNVSPAETQVFRILTLTTPYAGADLIDLVFRQRRNEVLITHPDYPTQLLTRIDQDSWTIVEAPFSATAIISPTGLAATASAVGAASILWTVTAVGEDGKESPLTTISTLSSIVNYTAAAGNVVFTWTRRDGARYYKIYRSMVFPGEATAGQELGYIGKSLTPRFVDNNIIPDFTQNPPMRNNPFQGGRIEFIQITNGGTGYTTATVSIAGAPGTGFSGFPLVQGGVIQGVVILDRGKNYVNPIVTFGGAGAGATATAVLGPADGAYPAAAVVYNQRLWLMGSNNFPLRLTASRLEGDLLNFNESIFPTATDPITLDIDSGELTPIRYGEIVSNNLFIFTDQSIWQVNLDEGEYVATLRTENGVGRVAPILINRDILFPLAEGTGVWALKPSNLPNNYVDADLTTFAGHLFNALDPIIAWGFAREPYRVLWAATLSGQLLSMTYLSEQNVYAWMPHDTRGLVRALEVLREDGIDRVYIAVERTNGTFFERFAIRENATPEDIWSVDCALRTLPNNPAATLTVELISGYQHICTASSSVFSPADVGAHVRAGGGRGSVVQYTSATQIIVEFDMPITARIPQSNAFPIFASGTWSLDALFSQVTGLGHLEGQVVEIFADGSNFGTASVVEGQITLDQPASFVVVGLGFTGFCETLPLTVSDAIIEDKVKRITGLSFRIENTRGLYYGVGDVLYPMKERTTEAARAPTRFQNGIRKLTVRSDWREDEPIRFEKRGPTASSVLNLIVGVEFGDDDD